ncbi:hypothetical protein [Mucilaginibacter agri]|uniref:Uncharacterized protein n=1 Tax=Mucilaginibacter agri TaxID=2695265 RepID=A0A965ZHJ4_9SPHI|nr:hypothetical protein [Mucilaginibacter agri]NCD71145.1 hypothetical protein [Mucilaginibacter agri]
MNLKSAKQMIPFLFIVFGSLITVCAAYYDYQQKLNDKQDELNKERKRNEEYRSIISKSNDIISNNNHIIATQDTVIETTTKIIDLQNELDRKNSMIQLLQNNTLENVTGGKSVPFILFVVFDKAISMEWGNPTNLPIRNVEINISRNLDKGDSDYERDSAQNINVPLDVKAVSKYFSYGPKDLPLQFSEQLLSETFDANYTINLSFTVRWLNGFYSGLLRCAFDKDDKFFIYDSTIYEYTDGFDYRHAVFIQGYNGQAKSAKARNFGERFFTVKRRKSK